MRKLLLVSMVKFFVWSMASTVYAPPPPPVLVSADEAGAPSIMDQIMQYFYRGTRPALRTKRVRGTTWA